VSRWRSGDTVPSDPEPLAAVLGVPVSILVYGPTAALEAHLDARPVPAGL
jgi:hypothetical protein